MQQTRDAQSDMNKHQMMKYCLKLQNYQTISSHSQKKRGRRSTTTRKFPLLQQSVAETKLPRENHIGLH
eukprot:886253-Amphidinium_carterae.1